jgi:hypothetical protein
VEAFQFPPFRNRLCIHPLVLHGWLLIWEYVFGDRFITHLCLLRLHHRLRLIWVITHVP